METIKTIIIIIVGGNKQSICSVQYFGGIFRMFAGFSMLNLVCINTISNGGFS